MQIFIDMWRECVVSVFLGIRDRLFGKIGQEVAKR